MTSEVISAAMRAVLVTAVFVAAIAAPSAASACTIAGPLPSPEERVESSDLAVWGKVVRRTRISGDEFRGTYRYRVRVLETYEGRVRRRIRVVGGTETSLCQAGLLRVGSRHGFLLHGRRGPWKISITSFISRKDLRSTGQPRRAS